MKKTAHYLLFAALVTSAFAEGVGNVAPIPEPAVPRFEKGDLVAFAGDSITSGGTYHKYIFIYWATRYPELGVRFRNKGIFSDFVHGGIGRLERDILKEKPNKVAINFGMNDSGASYRKDLFGMSDPDETVLQKRRETVATARRGRANRKNPPARASAPAARGFRAMDRRAGGQRALAGNPLCH